MEWEVGGGAWRAAASFRWLGQCAISRRRGPMAYWAEKRFFNLEMNSQSDKMVWKLIWWQNKLGKIPKNPIKL
jgi:hypothetical protein